MWNLNCCNLTQRYVSEQGKGILMRANLRSTSVWIRITAVVLLLVGSFVLVSAEKPVWTVNDKAYYADA